VGGFEFDDHDGSFLADCLGIHNEFVGLVFINLFFNLFFMFLWLLLLFYFLLFLILFFVLLVAVF